MKLRTTLAVLAVTLVAAAPAARADWNTGDAHKMHWPQLPDPNGWDIEATSREFDDVGDDVDGTIVGDDWQCSQTGFVTDIHIWGSWKDDLKPDVQDVEFVLSIMSNVPAGTSEPSHPGDYLWDYESGLGGFVEVFWGTGDQGWISPLTQEVIEHDHTGIWQYNFFIPEAEAFEQQEGTIYWLTVEALVPTTFDGAFGWKTSISQHFEDDAAWIEIRDDVDILPWQELRDPLTGESLDMAFVITPEPATLVLLGLGAVGLVARRRSKK